jgi:hypothetical protein
MIGHRLGGQIAAAWRFLPAWCSVLAAFTVAPAAAAPPPTKIEQVAVVFKTHLDMAIRTLPEMWLTITAPL